MKNLILADAKFAVHDYSGCIAGSNHYGYISGCHVLSDVTICTPASYAFNVGGIAGYNMGTVTGCTSAASIVNIYSSNEDNGGVVGYNGDSGTVSDCLFLGNTLGNPEKKVYGLGAIVGLYKGTVRNSFYTSTTIQGRDGNGNLLANEESAVGQNNGTVSNCGSNWSNEIFVNGDEYTIQTATGWNIFYCLMYHNDLFNRFSGKTVKLGADISVTRMAGSATHDFCGTFDGNHKTITFNYGSEAEPESGISALFSHTSSTKPFGVDTISPATIKDLTVGGTIWTSSNEAAGFVGRVFDTLNLTGCTSNIAINSTAEFPAGFINYSAGSSTVNISGCTSNAIINTTASYGAGVVGQSPLRLG